MISALQRGFSTGLSHRAPGEIAEARREAALKRAAIGKPYPSHRLKPGAKKSLLKQAKGDEPVVPVRYIVGL